VAALVRYNIMYVLAYALAFVGAYALVRQLGATRLGALVAGAAFAYAPWRLGQGGHLHVLSSGGIALALAMLARGHGWSLREGYRPDRVRPGWALAGWLVAAWQITLGFGIGLPFAYLLAVVAVIGTVLVLVRGPRRWLPLVNVAGGAVFAAVGAFMAYPYLKVIQAHPYAKRTVEDLQFFSPPLKGFLIAPPESLVWGDAHLEARQLLPWAPEMTMLPGYALLGLATAGLFFSIWTVRQRTLLAIGVVVSVLYAMGTAAPDRGRFTYVFLFENLPGFDGLRTPGRLVLWTTLLLGVLAAGTVGAFTERGHEVVTGDRVPGRGERIIKLAALLPFLLVLGEGLHQAPHPTVPTAPAILATARPPLLVLPSDQLHDENVMLWATDRFPVMVNGGSGFTPRRQDQIRRATKTFPDQASVDLLRSVGVHTVVVLRAYAPGSGYEGALTAPTDGLGISREETPEAVVFTLG
jgi:hypothetical protein